MTRGPTYFPIQLPLPHPRNLIHPWKIRVSDSTPSFLASEDSTADRSSSVHCYPVSLFGQIGFSVVCGNGLPVDGTLIVMGNRREFFGPFAAVQKSYKKKRKKD